MLDGSVKVETQKGFEVSFEVDKPKAAELSFNE